MYVKPAPNLSVPDPERGGYLSPEGAAVPDTEYWRRRLADGDVSPAKPAKAAKGKE